CGRITSSAPRTALQRHPSGRRRRPAFRPRMYAHLPESGAGNAFISRPEAGATAMAGAAPIRPGSHGHAARCGPLPRRGSGKPGINMGNLQWGCPLDFNFYFPGYADGGMSGDLENTSMPVALYQRMPQLPTISSTFQRIPRIWMPEAIADGKAEGYAWIGKSI